MAFYEDPRVTNKEHVQYLFSSHLEQHQGVTRTISHWHEMIELQYCTKGVINVNINNKSYKICEGDLCIINSGEIHGWHSNGDCEFIIVQLEPEILNPKSKKVPQRKYMYPFIFPGTQNQRVFTKKDFGSFSADKIIHSILDECTNMSYGFELAVESDLYQLFLWILRFFKQKGMETNNHSDTNKYNYAFAEKMYDYVQNNYHTNITARDAAKYMNMSYNYFSKVFNSVMDKNFSAYVNMVRLRKAEHMLVKTNKSVLDIAVECGFGTSSYFISRFRDKNGISPLHYRKSLGGKENLK